MEAPNPFTERGIIRDPKRFFGRKHELKQIFERLAAMQSVSIVGERRIGKSSLLAVITATGTERLGKDYEFHYIDLQLVGSTEDFIARALDALNAEGETMRDLERALASRKVVLCLDEFEQSGNYSKDFFTALRGIASNGELALVVASQHKLADLASNGVTTSPFFNIFTSLWLGAMDRQESAALLNGLGQLANRTFTDNEIEAAYQETRGNPWKLQIFGYYLVETGDLVRATEQYRQELARTRPRGGASTRPMGNRLAAVLLIAASLIGFLSIILNLIVPGMILALALLLLSFLIEGLRGLRQHGAAH